MANKPGSRFSFGIKEATSSKQVQPKLKSFPVGKNVFKKQKEEKDAKKKIDELAAAKVFEEFKASFEDPGKSGKAFVRGQIINPESGQLTPANEAGSLYMPTSKLLETEKPDTPKSMSTIEKLTKKKEKEKKKSILELFREELKRSQEDREVRQKLRKAGQFTSAAAMASPSTASSTPAPAVAPTESIPATQDDFHVAEFEGIYQGSHDTGDPLTTNLYVGNIHPKMNEEMLCQTFGKFGPLASVKVMWPRTEEERARNKNSGFVAFMKREDGARCLDEMKDSEIMGYKIQIGWGKAVALPPNPIYVAPNQKEEEEAKFPDPPSGLPFNAQQSSKLNSLLGKPGEIMYPDEKFGDKLYKSLVRVVIPTDENVLRVIHRMIEFVIREGPMFEAMIMNRELNNPTYQFLFDNQSPAHIYYRWKLFSILQGDSPETWKTEEFRMFQGGSMWKPPPLKRMKPPPLPELQEIVKKGQLPTKSRDKLEDLLRNLTMERKKVTEAMIWCVEHADGSEEIIDCITESLTLMETPLTSKIARLYLVTDILHNCAARVSNVSSYRRGFEGKLMQVFEHFHTVFNAIPSKLKAEQFRKRVMAVLRALQAQSIYHWDFMTKLINTFVGHTYEEMEKKKAFDIVVGLMTQETQKPAPVKQPSAAISNIDGVPIDENQPIDFSKTAVLADIDGVPLEDVQNIDGQPLEGNIDGDDIGGEPVAPKQETHHDEFKISSKWEQIDAEQVSGSEEEDEKKGSKWSKPAGTSEQTLYAGSDEQQRKRLRHVEVQVMKLQDALESSGSYTKAEIMERVAKFRDKLKHEALAGSSKQETHSEEVENAANHPSASSSPASLTKYNLDDSPVQQQSDISEAVDISPARPSNKRSPSPSTPPSSRKRKRAKDSSTSKKRKSRSRSSSPVKKRHGRSGSPKHSRRSHSKSPKRKRSRSPSKKKKKTREHSHSPRRSRSRSPTRKSKKRSRSRSPKEKHKKSKH